MEIVAIRDKRLVYIGLLASTLFLIVLVLSWIYAALYVKVIVSIIEPFLLGVFGYLSLLPKNAIILDDGVLTMRFAFTSKKIPAKNLQYNSYNEIGTFAARQGFWDNLYIIRNDIRTLTVTFSDEGINKHRSILLVRECRAVSLRLNELAKEYKDKTQEIL